MTRVASLGMYDGPATCDANDRLWSAIADTVRAAGLNGVPTHLDRDRPLDAIWDDPDLLFAQTCGYPLMARWRGRLRYLATPCYDAEGCDGPYYRSRIIVRRDDPARSLRDYAGRRFAMNDPASNSGMNLPRALVAPLASGGRFFSRIIITGSHAASAEAVANGIADMAAIDAITFTHLEREAPHVTATLATLAWSAPSPGLPFVTSIATPPSTVRLLRKAIRHAILAEPDAARALLLTGIETLGLRRYGSILALERQAGRTGYPKLA